jgi:hypothetical protein
MGARIGVQVMEWQQVSMDGSIALLEDDWQPQQDESIGLRSTVVGYLLDYLPSENG